MTKVSEIWLPINGYEWLYEISNIGKVRSIKKGLMYPSITKVGYLQVVLWKAGQKPKADSVHRMVAIHFVENPELKKCVNHKDGNKLNNHFCNLEWVTHTENMKHAYKIGLLKDGEMHGNSKISDKDVQYIRDNYVVGSGRNKFAKMFNISPALVSLIASNKRRNVQQ